MVLQGGKYSALCLRPRETHVRENHEPRPCLSRAFFAPSPAIFVFSLADTCAVYFRGLSSLLVWPRMWRNTGEVVIPRVPLAVHQCLHFSRFSGLNVAYCAERSRETPFAGRFLPSLLGFTNPAELHRNLCFAPRRKTAAKSFLLLLNFQRP